MKKLICLAAILLFVLTSCKSNETNISVTEEQLAKFTTNMTATYDSEYFAIVGVNVDENDSTAVINIFSADGDSVYSFDTVSIDYFLGICWEKDTYNLWVLTSDNGPVCYKHENREWSLDETANSLNI